MRIWFDVLIYMTPQQARNCTTPLIHSSDLASQWRGGCRSIELLASNSAWVASMQFLPPWSATVIPVPFPKASNDASHRPCSMRRNSNSRHQQR